MKFLVFVILLLLSLPVQAQEYLEQPICFSVNNTAEYSIYGEVRTDKDIYRGDENFYALPGEDNPDERQISHSATFRLQPGEDIPVCTTGPLFPGGRIMLRLRTLIPVFECMSSIYPGAVINIRAARRNDDSGVEYWAECL